MVVDVGDGDDLDVGLSEKRIEKLVSPAARADQAEPDLLIGAKFRRRVPGRRARRSHRRTYPTVSTKSRRVIRSVAIIASPF